MNNKHHISSITKYLMCLLLLVMYANGCSDAPFSPTDEENPPPGGTTTFGLVEVTFKDIGTDHMTATAQPAASNVAADLTRPDDPGGKDGTIQLEAVSHGSFTYGTRGSGGVRYLYATFKVRNAQVDGTPYSAPRTNLTFLAVDTDGTGTAPATYGQTPLSELRLYNGDQLSATEAEVFANAMVPTGLAKLAADGSIGVQYADVLQIYTEDEITGITNLPTGVSLFPYGFITQNPNNPESRTLPAGPGTGQFDGFVTFAFKIPLQAQANQDPFEITALFLPFDDDQTRLTQSLEGQTADGKRQTLARAEALDAKTVTIFPGSGYQGAFRLLCGPVRVTGTATNPSTVLFPPAPTFSSLSPDPYATDGSASNMLKTQAFSADFSGPVSGATPSTFIVRGSQSGLQSLTYSGNGSSTITTSNTAFFSGEQVTVSLMPGLGICPSAGPFRYRVETTAGNGSFTATSDSPFAVGDYPHSVALGDLNGDGVLDMVVANRLSDNVSVLKGDGNGRFSVTFGLYAADERPISIALGDLNSDGALDMVVANTGSDNVRVRLGDGAGGFGPATEFAAGNGPVSVALGDLNGDGALDMAVANAVSDKVRVRLGNGLGGFGAATKFTAGNQPVWVALGDVNGDGALDMAVANRRSDNVSVLLGDGSGGFGSAANFQADSYPQSVVLGDLNGDGILDMAVGNNIVITVLLGNGSGGFDSIIDLPIGNSPEKIALGDLNSDGILDMVVSKLGSDEVSVLLGDGAGGFLAASGSPYAIGGNSQSVVLGDLNSDGALDIVAVNSDDDEVSVLLGQL